MDPAPHRPSPAISAVAVGCVLVLAACGTTQVGSPPGPSGGDQVEEPHAWSYDGDAGPEHWGEDAPACAATDTSAQSPIDIVTAQLGDAPASSTIDLSLEPTRYDVVNTGHAVGAVPPEDGAAGGFTVDDVDYTVAQFHLHAPSEHTVDGVAAPLELHVVGAAPDGRLAVLAVMLDTGPESSELEEMFGSMPTEVTEEGGGRSLHRPVDLGAVVPDGPAARYPGSLTTPPCTEGLTWHVFLTPVPVSEEQIAAVRRLYDVNNRPLQPLNGREVTMITEAGGD